MSLVGNGEEVDDGTNNGDPGEDASEDFGDDGTYNGDEGGDGSSTCGDVSNVIVWEDGTEGTYIDDGERVNVTLPIDADEFWFVGVAGGDEYWTEMLLVFKVDEEMETECCEVGDLVIGGGNVAVEVWQEKFLAAVIRGMVVFLDGEAGVSTSGTKWFGVQIPFGLNDVCVHIMFAVPLGQTLVDVNTRFNVLYAESFLPFTGGYTELIEIPKTSAAAIIVQAEDHDPSVAQSIVASVKVGEINEIALEYLRLM